MSRLSQVGMHASPPYSEIFSGSVRNGISAPTPVCDPESLLYVDHFANDQARNLNCLLLAN